jgi:hypothetical protein
MQQAGYVGLKWYGSVSSSLGQTISPELSQVLNFSDLKK